MAEKEVPDYIAPQYFDLLIKTAADNGLTYSDIKLALNSIIVKGTENVAICVKLLKAIGSKKLPFLVMVTAKEEDVDFHWSFSASLIPNPELVEITRSDKKIEWGLISKTRINTEGIDGLPLLEAVQGAIFGHIKRQPNNVDYLPHAVAVGKAFMNLPKGGDTLSIGYPLATGFKQILMGTVKPSY